MSGSSRFQAPELDFDPQIARRVSLDQTGLLVSLEQKYFAESYLVIMIMIMIMPFVQMGQHTPQRVADMQIKQLLKEINTLADFSARRYLQHIFSIGW